MGQSLYEPFRGTFRGGQDFFDPINCARDNLRGQKSLGPLKMSLEMAHKVIVPPKKNISRSFLNSGTLIVIMYRRPTLCTLHIAVDFLKSLKIAVVWGGGVLLGYSAYIISL